MSRQGKKPHIYTPSTISELLSIMKGHPRSILFGGGTYLMSGYSSRPLAGEIISLSNIQELSRVNRSDSYLEIGSCVTIDHILNLKRYLGMKALFRALETIGTAPLRSIATIGGNIGLGAETVNLLPVLYLLETRIEIRVPGNTAWIPIRKYYEGDTGIYEGGCITRIRIPISRKSFEHYELIGENSGLETNTLAFCCLADINKEGIISSLGCSFCLGGTGIIRNMEMESIVEGKKIPLSRKDITRAVDNMETTFESLTTPVISLRRDQIIGLLRNTLIRMGEE